MKKKIGIIILVLVLVLTGGCIYYVNDYYKADADALKVVEEDGKKEDKNIVFEAEDAKAGLIFYPGGKVQYEAYAPLLESLSKQGITCILVHMPCNLAVLNQDAADGIQEQFPNIKNWYIAGHSLGGVMAASYVSKHTDEYKGIIFLAAYTTKDLSNTNLSCLSMYGSKDGVLNKDSYNENKSNLPSNTTEFIIEGGNHCQFGYYGFQDGDNESSISRSEQQEQAVNAIVSFINKG